MAGIRKFQPSCRVVAFVSILWLSSVSSAVAADPDYQQEAKDEYLGWIGRMAEKHEISRKVVAQQLTPLASSENTVTITVNPAVNPKNGKGNFMKVQEAIDSIPDDSSTRYIVLVAAGTYKEYVTISSRKGPISLLGSGMRTTKITYDLDSAQAGSTMKSASASMSSDNFICKDIAFENSSPSPAPGAVSQQAVAVMIQGDKGAFYRVAFLGYQDTLYDKKGRHYFKDCYIRGTIDFIFGDGTSYYEVLRLKDSICLYFVHLHPSPRLVSKFDVCSVRVRPPVWIGDQTLAGSVFNYCRAILIMQTSHLDSVTDTFGSLTAQKRATTNEATGYSFVDCTVNGTGYSYLGRAWGPASRVVFITTYLSAAIRTEGWYDWGVPARDKTIFYGEYQCYGPGSNRQGRAPWSLELTASQVEPFLTVDWIQGKTWLPSGPQ